MMNLSRRLLLKIASLTAISFAPFLRLARADDSKTIANSRENHSMLPLGVDEDGFSHVYHAKNGSPEGNLKKVLKMMGGIESVIGPKDIVIIKPNAQWWNQGMTNTDTLKAFIESVLGMPGFSGEIILAENHQFPEDNSRGWTTQERNGTYNYNELIEYFQQNGCSNVTKYHWHDGGPSVPGLHGGAEGGSVVKGPWEGDGYVWRHDMVYKGPSGYKTLMNYPVFTSSYSGTTIDLKNGAWKNGKYIDTPVKLINFPSLNHHGTWAGATAAIKNYLGIVDMTCGYRGTQPEGYRNFHYIGVKESKISKVHWQLEMLRRKLRLGYTSHFDGGAVGRFMHSVRMADLNIISAEWTGWGSRIDTSLRARTKSVLAGKDPVALDYYAFKNVLLPVTPKKAMNIQHNYSFYECNDPDRTDNPLRWYLKECHQQGIGNFSQDKVKVYKADLSHA